MSLDGSRVFKSYKNNYMSDLFYLRKAFLMDASLKKILVRINVSKLTKIIFSQYIHFKTIKNI